MQLCLQSGPKCREAQMFLGERCNALRDAFEFTHLLLKPATKETPEIGATIAWYTQPSAVAPHVQARMWIL